MENEERNNLSNHIAGDVKQQLSCASCSTQSNAITINNFGGKGFLQVIIATSDGGYIGIRHHEYNDLQISYNEHEYKDQASLRDYLKGLGYITNSDKWLAFKTFGQYKSQPQETMAMVLAEIKSILLVMGKNKN